MDGLAANRLSTARRGFWLALAGLFILVSAIYAHKASRNRSAFLRWREQVLALDGGTDIYQRYQYPNPPIMALILRPFAAIEPPIAGALLWFAIKLGLAGASLWMIFRLI